MNVIELKGIYKTYQADSPNPVRAVNGIDLTVEEGELAAIVGTSGSGKSTLLHILAGIDAEFEGTYKFCGKNCRELTQAQLAKIRNGEIGIVLQNFGLLPDMTVFDNVALPVYLSGRRYSSRQLSADVRVLLEEVGLADKVSVRTKQLSGGQKQRVAIARALINRPRLILADEPTGALDEGTSLEIMNVLTNLNQQGITIVIVTHDMAIARMCRRIITIRDGKIV